MLARLGSLLLVVHTAAWLCAAEPLRDERTLQTELKVSGPEVRIHAPLGYYYRPGCVFPLIVRVANPGGEFTAEVSVEDDSGGIRARLAEAEVLPSGSWQRLPPLPVRAPNVAANLSLVIREIASGSSVRPERFRARLDLFKPFLKTGARLILVCGKTAGFTHPGDQSEVAQVSGAALPDQLWMYDSADLVVITDDSLGDALPEAKTALRQWLHGGGRVFVTSASALPQAITAGLLPVAADVGDVGASVAWWEKHAGLRPRNILKSENHRPVYAYLDSGFGKTAFLFPATPETLAIQYGSEVFNSPILKRPREELFDQRVQPQAYAMFAAGEMNSARTGRALLWIGLGAVMFAVILLVASTSRLRLEAVGWPLAVAALLLVMLAHLFPEPELVVSRVSWTRASPDGRTLLHSQWTLAGSFRRPIELTADGPSAGTLTPLFNDADDLVDARGDALPVEDRLRLASLQVTPALPVLLQAARVELAGPASLPANSTELRAAAGSSLRLLPVRPLPENVQRKRAVLVFADGKFRCLENLAAPGGFDVRDYDNAPAALRSTIGGWGESILKARAVALSRATLAAARSGQDTLIVWGEQPEPNAKPLVELRDARYETASEFFLYSLPVNVVP